MCWDPKDAFLAHYEQNCKSCSHRLVGKGADMQPFIDRFENSRIAQREKREAAEKAEAEALSRRRQERAKVFDLSNPSQMEINSLLDEIDIRGDSTAREKLLEFANLARDTFTDEIVIYLKALAISNGGGLGRICADVFLSISDSVEEKVEVALAACDYGFSSLVAKTIKTHADRISNSEIDRIIGPLAYRAVTFNL